MPSLVQTSDVITRTRWYVRIRWYFLTALTVPGLASFYGVTGWSDEFVRDLMLVSAALASNGVFYLLAHGNRRISLLVADILLISFFIFSKGGIESRSPILYSMPILMSAAIFGRHGLYAAVSLIVLLYDSLILADYFGIVRSLGSLTNLHNDLPYVINTVIFMTSILILVAILADFITRLLIKKEQQALATADALKRAQSIAKIGSWEWHITDDKIEWSEELYRIFGLAPGQTFNLAGILTHIYPEDREEVRRAVTDSVKKQTHLKVQHRIKVKNSIRHIQVEGEVCTDKHGIPWKMNGTARDITDDLMLDHAKSEFVSLASHQLRTPATAVKILLAMLKDGYVGVLNSKQTKLLHKTYEANERQLGIINDILNVARIESGKVRLHKTRLDLSVLLRTLTDQQAPQTNLRKQQVLLSLPAKPLPVSADKGFLTIAIENILSNASKYTPRGGTITVSLRRYRSSARLTITDTGVGIPKKEMPQLFQRFNRINNTLSEGVEGSGLGLYITKHIIELHDGLVSAKSRPGRGTSFIISIPLSNQIISQTSATHSPVKTIRKVSQSA